MTTEDDAGGNREQGRRRSQHNRRAERKGWRSKRKASWAAWPTRRDGTAIRHGGGGGTSGSGTVRGQPRQAQVLTKNKGESLDLLLTSLRVPWPLAFPCRCPCLRIASGLRVLYGNPGLRLFCRRPGLWLLCLVCQRPGLGLVATKEIVEEVRGGGCAGGCVGDRAGNRAEDGAGGCATGGAAGGHGGCEGEREFAKKVLGHCWRSSSSRQVSNGGV